MSQRISEILDAHANYYELQSFTIAYTLLYFKLFWLRVFKNSNIVQYCVSTLDVVEHDQTPLLG